MNLSRTFFLVFFFQFSIPNTLRRSPILVLFGILFGQYLFAQIAVNEEPDMLYYERTHPRITNFRQFKNFRDVFHKDKFLMGKNRIMGNISYNTGRVLIDDGHNNIYSEYRQASGFYLRIRFFEEFSINTNFYKDFNPQAKARWIADYTYSIGRYNWRAHKWNYGYENYANNKYYDNRKTIVKKFMEGYYFLSYNFVPEKFNKLISIDSTTSLRFIFFTRYAINYRDENEITHGEIFNGKPTFGGAVRYTILWNIYAESAAYYYVNPEKKQPWDPDYTYGFGYFDWRSFRLSLTYGNWAINRFPWNKSYYPDYNLQDGIFRVVANWMW